MKSFTKSEIKNILTVLFVLSFVFLFNISISLRKGRDSVRKDDISAIQRALDTYYQKYRVYPVSDGKGQIFGCFNEAPSFDVKTRYPLNAVPCIWGESKFEDPNLMPRDPNYKDGSSYLYISNGKSYEIYISLEGKKEAEYTQLIVEKNLQCGNKICNYGREVL